MNKFLSLVFLVTFSTLAQEKVVIDKVVGKVDNYIILKSEVEGIIARSASQGQPVSKMQAMQTMLINKMLVAKAELDSVKVEDKMIDNDLNARMQQMITQFGSEKNIVEAYGKSLDQLKNEVRSQVREQKLAQEMQETIQNGVKITPKEVKEFFNSIPKDSLPVIPTEVEMAQIIRFAKVKKAMKDELKSRLNGYRERIMKGESFAKLANEYSEDPGSKTNGGLYLNTKRGMFDPAYEAAVFKLKPGEITEVVESSFGFHVIKLEEMKGQEYSSRHILLRPDYNRLDLTEAKAYLDSIKKVLVADTISVAKVAKENSEDDLTKDTGGLMLNQEDGSTKQPMDERMDYNLYFIVSNMEVGQVSEPLEYRSEDGKTGMRIVKLVKKYEPHVINLKDDYQKISNIALENKKTKILDDWFSKAIKDVFIQVDSEYEGSQNFNAKQ